MSFLAILLLSQTASPKAILDRYEQYRKLHPAFSADWNLTGGSQTIAHGSIMVDGIARMLFKAASGNQSYSLSESEKGVIELAPAEETYEEYPPISYIAAPPSKLGPAASYLPVSLTRTSAYASSMKYSVDPPITVDGEQADVVAWTIVIQMQPIKFTLAVDAEGRIVRMTRTMGSGGPGGPTRGAGAKGAMPSQAGKQPPGMEWTITNYHPIAHTSLTAFYTPIPRGYVPFSMPAISSVHIEVDEAFPSVPWMTGASVRVLKTGAGKPEVIVITSPDSVPSQNALASLDKIKAGVSGVSFEAVSLARSASESHGLPYDSTGKASAAIGDTSTPLFVLVDGAGKIKNLWAGFDPSSVSEFQKQISEAVKNLSVNKT